MSDAWWQSGVIYQIYPRSFQDSNADGIGDLQGIIRRLDHCLMLGVDALWLSPIYSSPMADFGYDVANFTDIDPIFGSLAEFDLVMAAVKQRGMKLILDYVPNHTSDAHPWFIDSRSSRSSSKRDWYLWRDPAADGGPPNNWLSNFGGSAWQWDEVTGQYYYHAFLKEQPDLNWRNPGVVAAMHDVLRFWLKRGVDGFRVDVLWLLIKDDLWRDNPPNPDYTTAMAPHRNQFPLYTTDRPEVLEVISGLRKVVDEFDDRVLIGEIYLPLARLMAYYGTALDGVHLPFNFQLFHTAFNARAIAELIGQYELALPQGAWPNWVLGNHDNPRIATRVGRAQARVAAMLLLTLRGTPTLYYGDEIGMRDVAIAPHQVQDPCEKNLSGLGLGRDPCRTPMQWDGSVHAGFTAGDPWLPVSPDYPSVNAGAQLRDSTSLLRLYQELLQLRRTHRALSMGNYAPLAADGDLLAYVRETPDERILVVLNLGSQAGALSFDSVGCSGRVLLSSFLDRNNETLAGKVDLRPAEGVIAALSAASRSNSE